MTSSEHTPAPPTPAEHRTAVTIGNFDGVHIGHAALVKAARKAVGDKGRVIVIAFDPHPASRLKPGTEPGRLTTFEYRVERLTEMGADLVERLEPTDELLGLTPEEFIERLVDEHHPSVLIEGPDFHFGKDRAGTPETLRNLADLHGFEAIMVSPVQIGLRDQSVVTASSSIARWLLENGRVRDTAFVLGRPYVLAGTVAEGDRRGRTIGFPTANLIPRTEVPGAGVYAAIASVPEMGPGMGVYAAAVNIGTRPTFEGEEVRVEAHLLDIDILNQQKTDWAPLPGLPEYGWELELELISRIRDEVRFGSVDELVGQLGRDIQTVRDRIGPIGPGRHQHLENSNA